MKPPFLRLLALAILLGLSGHRAAAHVLNLTQVLVSFDQPGTVMVKVDADLTVLMGGSTEAYSRFAHALRHEADRRLATAMPDLLDALQLFVGEQRLQLVLQGYTLPTGSRSDFDDPSLSKPTTLRFLAVLPPTRAPVRLEIPIGAKVDYPIAFTVQVPAARVSVTRWLENGMHESDAVDWAAKAGAAAPGEPGAVQATADAAADAIDRLPWHRQLGMYLRLGFSHIVPEGADHILFVLGLFFLGLTWRKLLSQTTVFTIAHATTLFLSAYGIFRLPSRFVEPAIAASIAFIALENVFSPRLGPSRLAVVFAFGLIHGLGFASSLSQVPFPKHQFIVALLGFNFGVDAGQLFVVGVAFLCVGWFRRRPWFRARIAIPCSLSIAAVGLFWAIQRVVFYSRHT